MKDEWVNVRGNFYFLVTLKITTSNNAIYKTKLEFKSPSISAHFDIWQMHFYP